MNMLFPYSAITGQADLKLALFLNAVNPRISGVLIRGEKGTAKSTSVRAVSELLPEIKVVKGCELSCDPDAEDKCVYCCNSKISEVKRKVRVVTLPLNATEDMVAGGMDFQSAVKTGQKKMAPGILAKAHRGFLYIDEVNLLDDHLTDIILDSASSGINSIEREGISFSHPADFVLIGTMNPEEGELRPQFLDRFGLCVEVFGEKDPETRVSLMTRREAFDADPSAFRERYRKKNERESEKIRKAKSLLKKVKVGRIMRKFITELSRENNVAGHRADLVIEQAAMAHAALSGKQTVTTDDIIKVARFALAHRKRDESSEPPPPENKQDETDNMAEEKDYNPPDEETDGGEQNRDQSHSHEGDSPQNNDDVDEDDISPPYDNQDGNDEKSSDSKKENEKPEEIHSVGETFQVKKITTRRDRVFRNARGKRSRSLVLNKQGRHIRSIQSREMTDIAIDATIRAAAPFQKSRQKEGGRTLVIRNSDIHRKIREKKTGNFILFLVDASGSMGGRGRMTASKGAVMSLLLDAYKKRDKVSLVSFRRREAFVNLPPTSSIDLAAKLLSELPVGGRTPFSAGLSKSYEVIRTHLLKEPLSRPVLIIITDGKSNVSFSEMSPVEESLFCASRIAEDDRIRIVVIDTEEKGHLMFGLAEKLAVASGADYFKTEDLKVEELIRATGAV